MHSPNLFTSATDNLFPWLLVTCTRSQRTQPVLDIPLWNGFSGIYCNWQELCKISTARLCICLRRADQNGCRVDCYGWFMSRGKLIYDWMSSGGRILWTGKLLESILRWLHSFDQDTEAVYIRWVYHDDYPGLALLECCSSCPISWHKVKSRKYIPLFKVVLKHHYNSSIELSQLAAHSFRGTFTL